MYVNTFLPVWEAFCSYVFKCFSLRVFLSSSHFGTPAVHILVHVMVTPLSVPLYSTRDLHFVTSKDQHYYFNFHLSIIPHNLITPFFFLKMTLLGCDLHTIKLIHLKYSVAFSILVDRGKQHHGQLSSSQKATLVSQLWSSSTSSLLPPHPQAWATTNSVSASMGFSYWGPFARVDFYHLWSSVTDFFHCIMFSRLSVIQYVSALLFSVLSNSTPLYCYTTFCLFIYSHLDYIHLLAFSSAYQVYNLQIFFPIAWTVYFDRVLWSIKDLNFNEIWYVYFFIYGSCFWCHI